MKVILQDGKTELMNVNKVDERIDIADGAVEKTLVIQVDTSETGSITGDDAIHYYNTIGMEGLTVVDKNGIILKTYNNFPVLSSIYMTYSEKAKYLNLTFKESKVG